MNLQYIINNKGDKSAVLLPITDWNKIQRDLEAYERLKDKKAFFEGLTSAFYEVKLITEGNKKPNSFDDLLDEL